MIPEFTPEGVLPVGRYKCSLEEVEARFCGAGSSLQRQGVWADFLKLTAILRSVAHAPAAWLGGSFTTAKADPGDVDVLYLVDLVADHPSAHQILDLVTSRTHGLRVDSYVLGYQPDDAPDVASSRYLPLRGYWDDWWGRYRDPDPSVNRLTRRGYLEVTLDGYQPHQP